MKVTRAVLVALAISVSAGASFAVGNPDLYVSLGQNTIAKLNSSGAYSVFATSAGFPDDMAFDTGGNLYVACNSDGIISRITPSGLVSTFVTGFSAPTGLAFDVTGTLFVSDDNRQINEVSPAGVVSPFVTLPYFAESIAFGPDGDLYAALYSMGIVARIAPSGKTSYFAWKLSEPSGLAFDKSGNLYVTNFNYGHGMISRVTPDGTVTVFASGLGGICGLAFDLAGNLFVADADNSRIEEISPTGAISVFASGLPGNPRGVLFSTVPEPATLSLLALGGLLLARRRRA